MRKYTTIIVVLVCAIFFVSAATAGLGSSLPEEDEEKISAYERAYSQSDGVDVPTLGIGTSWTYDQDLWQNDTEKDEYVYLDEVITYTVERVEYFSRGGKRYLGYNISVEGEIVDGEIDSPDVPIGTIDIAGGHIDGYQFLKMSDLAIVEDRQFRYYHASYLGTDIEGWLYMNQSHQTPTEYYDFPIREGDLFWSNMTRRSWGFNKVVGPDEKKEWNDDMLNITGENSVLPAETKEVPAGEFETHPVRKEVSGDENGTQKRWYSPEVGSSVKEVIHGEKADMIMSLKDYNFVESSNELSIEPSEAEVGEEVSLSGQFPDYPNEGITISLPEGTEPVGEWNFKTDGDGRFNKSIEVPVAEDMTETKVDFSSVGFVAEVTNETIDEYAVSTLIIHHDNAPVFPEPKDGTKGINLNPELGVVVGHRKGKDVNVTFYNASDDSQIGSDEGVPSGDYARTRWDNLSLETTYEWYVEADDGEETFESDVWNFTTEEEKTPYFEVDIITPGNNQEFVEGESVAVEYEVENTGPVEGTQEIEFKVEDNSGGVVHDGSETVDNLTSDEVYSGSFEWSTAKGDTGDYDIIVNSQDDEDEVPVTISKQEYELVIAAEEGGTTEPGPGTYTYVDGDEVTVEAIPNKGWTFDEWTGDVPTGDASGENITIVMNEDKELTATFKERHDLTINIEGQGTTDPAEGNHTYTEGEGVTVEATPDEDWKFVEWTGDASGTSSTISITMDEDKEITAVFEEEVETYELTTTTEGEGSVNRVPEEDVYEEGTNVTLTAVPDEGWYFEGWMGTDKTGKEITITMDEDKEITAQFGEIADHLLTINVEGEGSTDPVVGTHTYPDGDEVTVKATPDEGWYFEEWTGDHEGTKDEITIKMDEDKEITASFGEIGAEENILTINIDGGGSTDPAEGTHIYEEGEEVTITATADEGWSFEEWTGTDETGEEITITMDEDKDITAHFEEYEPAYFEVEIISYDKDVKKGEEITVEYKVTNTGELEDTQDIALYLDGEEVAVKSDLTLAPGEEYEDNFTVDAEKVGEQTLEIGSNDEMSEEEEMMIEEKDTDDGGSFLSNYWWLLVVLLIGIIALIALVFVMKGGEEEESPEESSFEQPPPPGEQPQQPPAEPTEETSPGKPPEEPGTENKFGEG